MLPENSPDDDGSTRETFPDCPACGEPVLLVATRGPDSHACQPCGCPVSLGAMFATRESGRPETNGRADDEEAEWRQSERQTTENEPTDATTGPSESNVPPNSPIGTFVNWFGR